MAPLSLVVHVGVSPIDQKIVEPLVSEAADRGEPVSGRQEAPPLYPPHQALGGALELKPASFGPIPEAPSGGNLSRPVEEESRANRQAYLSVNAKFIVAVCGAVLWMSGSIYLSLPWFADLQAAVGPVLAPIVIGGIAIIPGFMNAFLVTALLVDRRPEHRRLGHYPPVSILIAAYNESAAILETIESIRRQDYPGQLEVIVIDDGSQDDTAALVTSQLAKYPWLQLIGLDKNGGKASALNAGLEKASWDIVLTVDADSYLYKDALQNIVERYLQDPPNTRAVAGTVLVRNSRLNWITRAQEWDYFHGISAIKRVQSLFQGTLVAQGAFSLYDRQLLLDLGGWSHCVGEDIVLTWAILRKGYRVGHSEQACVFTNAPDTVKQFVRQRQRWSRGMVEGFKRYPSSLVQPRLSTFFIYWNLAFPLLDFTFTFFFIPGIVLALFGNYMVAGPMTLALLPVAMVMNYLMFVIGKKNFAQKGLRVRANVRGFLVYTLAYNLILQPACLIGYLSEMLNTKKSWGTK